MFYLIAWKIQLVVSQAATEEPLRLVRRILVQAGKFQESDLVITKSIE